MALHAEREPDPRLGDARYPKTGLVDLFRGPRVELRHLQPDGGKMA